MDALRQASQPLTVRQLVVGIMAHRGLAAADKHVTKDLLKCVGMILRHLRGRGTAVSELGQGVELVWRVAR